MFDMGSKNIWSLLVKVSHSNRNFPQIWAVYSTNHTGEIFGYLNEIDNSGNFAAFFTSITEKVGLSVDIVKENIGYGRLSQDVRWKTSRKHLEKI